MLLIYTGTNWFGTCVCHSVWVTVCGSHTHTYIVKPSLIA